MCATYIVLGYRWFEVILSVQNRVQKNEQIQTGGI